LLLLVGLSVFMFYLGVLNRKSHLAAVNIEGKYLCSGLCSFFRQLSVDYISKELLNKIFFTKEMNFDFYTEV
jgi:hypothetical protein